MKPELILKSPGHGLGACVLAAFSLWGLSACYNPKNVAEAPRWRVEPVLHADTGGTPRLGESYYRLARYYDGQGRGEQAERAYRRAITADPLHAEAHNALGVMLAGQGRMKEALAELEHAHALEPGRAHILNNLGYANQLAGQTELARSQFDAALRLDPTHVRAQQNLAQLERRALPSIAAAAVPAPVPVLSSAPLSAAAPVAQAAGIALAGGVMNAPPRQPERVPPQAILLQKAVPSLLVPLLSAAEPALRAYRLEISNAMGQRGAARRVSVLLTRDGAPAAWLNDQRPFDQPLTRVVYARGYQAEGGRIAARIGGVAEEGRELWRSRAVHVRVLLGKNIRAVLAQEPDETLLAGLTPD